MIYPFIMQTDDDYFKYWAKRFPELGNGPNLKNIAMSSNWSKYDNGGLETFQNAFITYDFGGISQSIELKNLPETEKVLIKIEMEPSGGYGNNHYWLGCYSTYQRKNNYAIAIIRTATPEVKNYLEKDMQHHRKYALYHYYLESISATEPTIDSCRIQLEFSQERVLLPILEPQGFETSVKKAINMGFRKATVRL